MPTIACPDCGHQVSTLAPTCPSCGRPIAPSQHQPIAAPAAGPTCPHCGTPGVAKVRGLQGTKEVAIGIVLLLAFIVPGIIYYVYMESIPYCTHCGRRAKPGY